MHQSSKGEGCVLLQTAAAWTEGEESILGCCLTTCFREQVRSRTAMVHKVKWHDKTQKKSSSCSSMLMMNLLVADSCLCMSGVGCYRLLSVFPVIIHFSWCPQSFLLQLGLFSSLQLVVSLLSKQNTALLRHHVSKIEQGAEQPRMFNGRSKTIKKNSWCIFFWLPLHRWSFVFFYRIIYNNAAHVSC